MAERTDEETIALLFRRSSEDVDRQEDWDWSKAVFRMRGELLRVTEEADDDLKVGDILLTARSRAPDVDGEYYVYYTHSEGVDTRHIHYSRVEDYNQKLRADILGPKRRKMNLVD